MRNVKWHMPVDPRASERFSQPASAVRATDPELGARLQVSAKIEQDLLGVERMFQNIRKHNHIVRCRCAEVGRVAHADCEARFSRYVGCDWVQLQTLHLKTIAGINSEAAAFVATGVEQAPRASTSMK